MSQLQELRQGRRADFDALPGLASSPVQTAKLDSGGLPGEDPLGDVVLALGHVCGEELGGGSYAHLSASQRYLWLTETLRDPRVVEAEGLQGPDEDGLSRRDR